MRSLAVRYFTISVLPLRFQSLLPRGFQSVEKCGSQHADHQNCCLNLSYFEKLGIEQITQQIVIRNRMPSLLSDFLFLRNLQEASFALGRLQRGRAAQNNCLQFARPAFRRTPRTPENISTTELGKRDVVVFVELQDVSRLHLFRHEKSVMSPTTFARRRHFHNVAKSWFHFGESRSTSRQRWPRPWRRLLAQFGVLSAGISCSYNVRSPLSGRNRTARSTCARFPIIRHCLALRDLNCVAGVFLERGDDGIQIRLAHSALIEEQIIAMSRLLGSFGTEAALIPLVCGCGSESVSRFLPLALTNSNAANGRHRPAIVFDGKRSGRQFLSCFASAM